MKPASAILALLAFAAPALAAPAGGANASVYDALMAMNGRWTVTDSHGHSRLIENRCARSGLFFECEQSVAGAPAALLVVLPGKSSAEGRFTLRTQTLTSGGDAPGPWRNLVIDGATWTWTDGEGRAQRRTVVTHSGPDYMHAVVQSRLRGGGWATLRAESFARAP